MISPRAFQIAGEKTLFPISRRKSTLTSISICLSGLCSSASCARWLVRSFGFWARRRRWSSDWSRPETLAAQMTAPSGGSPPRKILAFALLRHQITYLRRQCVGFGRAAIGVLATLRAKPWSTAGHALIGRIRRVHLAHRINPSSVQCRSKLDFIERYLVGK